MPWATCLYPDNDANSAADSDTDSDADPDSGSDSDSYTYGFAYSDGSPNIYSHEHADAETDSNAERRIQRRHLESVANPLLSDGRGERHDGNRSWLIPPRRHLPERFYPQRYRHPSPDGSGCPLLRCGKH
jgi:hypothetical protein